MIVAYVRPSEKALRRDVEAVVGDESLAFRDPDTFQPGDADPLDHVVYVADADLHIRQVYAGLITQVLSLDETPLQAPEIPFFFRRQRQQETARRAVQPVDAAAVPNVAPPDLTNPASNRLEGVKRVGQTPATPQEAVERASARRNMPEAARAVQTAPVAPPGVVRPNASARAQTTMPEEAAPVITVQKPAGAPLPASPPVASRAAAPHATPLVPTDAPFLSEPPPPPALAEPPKPGDMPPELPPTVGGPPRQVLRATTTERPKP